MKERSNTRNSILNQYGKVLPRVQRKLAIERAKPYQHPATIHREGTEDVHIDLGHVLEFQTSLLDNRQLLLFSHS